MPIYPMIANCVLTYIKDGEIIKNRGDREIDIITEIINCNDIAIERENKVSVYASSEKYDLLKSAKSVLSKWIKDIDKKIVIYRKN